MEDKKERTSITRTEGKKTTDITVERIDNGYLVTTCVTDYSGDKYESNTSKVFSKTNPLEEEEEEAEEEKTKKLAKGMNGLLDSLAGFEGNLNV